MAPTPRIRVRLSPSPCGRRADGVTRALGILALIGIAFLTVVCLIVQFLRTDLDWVTISLSIYAIGPYGAWVQASFFAAGPALAALGVGWYRALDRRSWSLVPLLLFVLAAVAVCVMAANIADPTPHPVTLHGDIHQWAAFATFMCMTIAMLLQSLQLRLDPRWSRHFPEALAIAAIAIVYFWIYALLKPVPRGIGEKAEITLVLLWCWRASAWLARSA